MYASQTSRYPQLTSSNAARLHPPMHVHFRGPARRWLERNKSFVPLPQRCASTSNVIDKASRTHPSEHQFGSQLTPITHLSEIHITNFALVASQRVRLSPGFNVITGESGSGKSVLIEALGQLLGSPASEDLIRPPATAAVVEGEVKVAPADQPALRRLLLSLGLPQRSLSKGLDTVSIRREISSGSGGGGSGGARSRCFLNGSGTSMRVLREVGRALVDVNGQHASVSLRDASAQLALVDRAGGLTSMASELSASWRELQAARAGLRALDALANEEDRSGLQTLVDDVSAARISPGEDSSLRRRLRQLDSRRDAAERCQLVAVGLGGGASDRGGVAEALQDVEAHIKAVLSQEDRLKASEDGSSGENNDDEGGDDSEEGEGAAALLRGALELLNAAQETLDKAGEAVQRYGGRYRFNQREYDELSSRLQELQRLLKEHGAASADELLEKAERAGNALDSFYSTEGRREEMEGELEALEVLMGRHATALSAARRRAGQRLKTAVAELLGELAMQGAAFDVRICWAPAAAGEGVSVDADSAAAHGESSGTYAMRAGGSGLDAVEFLFAAGPEEPLRPLSAVASGGEAARVVLAMKAAPAFLPDDPGPFSAPDSGSEDPELAPPIVVLDEIDSGVGSRLGTPVGRILRGMAAGGANAAAQSSGSGRRAQVLCVSHLPQVAAHAEHHICVRKGVDGDGGRVVSRFDALSTREERLDEIAAMMGPGMPAGAAEELMRAAEMGIKHN